MTVSEVATEFMVTALPVDHPANRHYAVWVQWIGAGQFMVCPFRNMQPRECWDVVAGEWTYSNGSEDMNQEEFMSRTRFPLERAMAIAREVAPGMTCNGFTVTDALAMNRRAL